MLNKGLTRYFSPEALQKLAAAHVGIAGAGGLGSNCAMLLVRSGVKRLTIVDFDSVEASNLNRQLYLPEDVGRLKVAALGEQLLRISPDLDLCLRGERLSAESAPLVFKGCDVVVEALDKAEYKAALISALLGPSADSATGHPDGSAGVSAGVSESGPAAGSGSFLVSASGLCGLNGPPMRKKRLGGRLVCVGDFESGLSDERPPLAPRVMQAAALQAEAVLEYLLREY